MNNRLDNESVVLGNQIGICDGNSIKNSIADTGSGDLTRYSERLGGR